MIAVNDFSIEWMRASSQTILLDVAMITQKGRLFTRPFWYRHR